MPRRALLPALFGLALVALGWVVLFGPWLGRKAPIATSTPGLMPVVSRALIPVRPGQTACIGPVRFEPRARRLVLTLETRRGSGPVRLVATAGDWRAVRLVPTPGTRVNVTDLLPLDVALPPFGGPARDGRVCMTNLGIRELSIVGSAEARSTTLALTTVDGNGMPDDARATLLVLERRDRSPARATGLVAEHASALTGGMVPPWAAWICGLLLAVAVPVGAFAALARAGADD